MNQPAETQEKQTLNRFGVRRIIQLIVMVLLYAVILFLCAGRLDWSGGWLFLLLYVGGIGLNAVVLRGNPELINERGRVGPNTKSWDRWIALFFIASLLALLAVGGLDARYKWSSMAAGWLSLGIALFILSDMIIAWTMKTNAFLAVTVRIQKERGHQVVTSGPYRYVRHPMYAAVILFALASPLIFASWWAFLPALCLIAVHVVRAALEDRTLHAELPGYKEYSQKTRYRLLPGIW